MYRTTTVEIIPHEGWFNETVGDDRVLRDPLYKPYVGRMFSVLDEKMIDDIYLVDHSRLLS